MRQDSHLLKTYLGRPAIITVTIRNSIVRIQITGRAIAIISITAKTGRFCPAAISTCFLAFRGKVPMLFLCQDNRICFVCRRGLQPLYSACSGAALPIKAWADPPLLRVLVVTAVYAYKERGEQLL